jgi:hypothetical protein
MCLGPASEPLKIAKIALHRVGAVACLERQVVPELPEEK